MSAATIALEGFDAGVKDYAITYWDPGYEPKDTDLLACFKVVAQQGVPREEAAAAVAAESSTGTWTTVWTDLLTDLDHYKGRAYRIEHVPGDPDAFYAFVAYPLDLFEEGSVVNVLTSLVGNVFGFKAIRSLRLEDIRFPLAFVLTVRRAAERDRSSSATSSTSTDVRCSAAPSSPSSACRPRTTAARCTNACAAGWTSPRTTRTSTRNRSCAGVTGSSTWPRPSRPREAETGERKGHYLNVTAGTVEDMFERAEFAKSLDMPIIMHDFLTAGFTANTSLANWCRRNGMLLHIHRAMHSVIDRNPYHGIHFRVLTKALRLSGGDHLHSGTVVGKLEGDRAATLGWIDLMREPYIPEDRSRGIFFDQDFGHLPGLFPVASGGIHVWHIPALVAIFGDDSVLQFGGGTLGHPWGNAAGATANRVAVEACVMARNEGRDVEKEGRDILRDAAVHSPELAAAMETWKEVRFDFDVVDTLDPAHA